MSNLVDGDRILALVKGETVGVRCYCHRHDCENEGITHNDCTICNGTSRIRTEPENDAERAVADLFHAGFSTSAELERCRERLTLRERAFVEEHERHGTEACNLRAALEAERTASEEWRQKCVNERVRYDNEKEAHEETKRQLAEAHEGMLRDRQARVVADNNLNQALREKVEAEAHIAELENKLDFENSENAFQRVNKQRQEFLLRAMAAEQRATEAEAARDAIWHTSQDLSANIETLREALRWVLDAEYPIGVPIGAASHWTDAQDALATTPTSGFVEKVRAVCCGLQEVLDANVLDCTHGPDQACEDCDHLRHALTALYAIAPGLKPRG